MAFGRFAAAQVEVAVAAPKEPLDAGVALPGVAGSTDARPPPSAIDKSAAAASPFWGTPGPFADALLGGWGTLAAAFGLDDSDELALRRFRERVCFPAAFAWSLLQLPASSAPPPRHDRPIVVWLVGARANMEGRLVQEGGWGLLSDVFPELRWELVLVGPEMQNESEGHSEIVPADGGKARVCARQICLKGHEWAKRAPTPPDFAVCFNSGIGTLTLPLVRPWLETVEELLRLSVPVLFTCFSSKERNGEDLIIRQAFQACVLVDFLSNPLRPEPSDEPVRDTGKQTRVELSPTVLALEPNDEPRVCSAIVWWAWGSRLSSDELHEVSTTACPKLLKALAAQFALKGHIVWVATLAEHSRGAAQMALEMLSAATENREMARVLSKKTQIICSGIAGYTRKHGQHPEALPCVERLVDAKFRAKFSDLSEEDIREAVRQFIALQYGDVLAAEG